MVELMQRQNEIKDFFFRELKVKKMVIDWGKWDNSIIKNGLEKF